MRMSYYTCAGAVVREVAWPDGAAWPGGAAWRGNREKVRAECREPGSGIWNGPAAAPVRWSVSQGRVLLEWARCDYATVLAGRMCSDNELAGSPLWVRGGGIGLFTMLWCKDGWVWAKRSNDVDSAAGLWQAGAAEGAEPEDLVGKDWHAAGLRGVREEYGIDRACYLGAAWMHRRAAVREKISLLVCLSVPWMDISDVERWRAGAPDSWETVGVSTDTPPPDQRVPWMPLPQDVADMCARGLPGQRTGEGDRAAARP